MTGVMTCQMHRFVGDQEMYTPLNKDPLKNYKKEREKMTNKCFKQGIINKEKQFLVPRSPRTPIIYY